MLKTQHTKRHESLFQHFGQFLEKTDAGDISKNRGTITPISTDTSHGLHIKNCLKRYTQR